VRTKCRRCRREQVLDLARPAPPDEAHERRQAWKAAAVERSKKPAA